MSEISPQKHLCLALLLAFFSGICSLLLFPYLLALFPKLQQIPIPFALFVAIQVLQGIVLTFFASWLGLKMGAAVGLDCPFLRAWVYKQPIPRQQNFLSAAALGLAMGIVVAFLDRFLLMPLQPASVQSLGQNIVWWKGLLASFYGGWTEEILTRLFVMTFFVWLLKKITGSGTARIYSSGIVLAALIFAAAHLPGAAQLSALTVPVLLRVLLLNGLLGIPYGLLFWKKGLEHAMLAHFCTDIILHVVS